MLPPVATHQNGPALYTPAHALRDDVPHVGSGRRGASAGRRIRASLAL